jgi:FtsH-binding integral membrane protein
LNDRFREKQTLFESRERMMNTDNKEKYLKMSLRLFGVVFLLVYPLSIVWPSGWVWHGGEGVYYFQMIVGVYAVLGIFLIMAANNPSENRSLISFTVWSSVVHALIMAVQAFGDQSEHGHLVGDVPALLLVAAVLGYLSPRKSVHRRS